MAQEYKGMSWMTLHGLQIMVDTVMLPLAAANVQKLQTHRFKITSPQCEYHTFNNNPERGHYSGTPDLGGKHWDNDKTKSVLIIGGVPGVHI